MKIQMSQKPAVMQTMKQSNRNAIHPYLRMVHSFLGWGEIEMRSKGC
jgi:hypothetical protein